MTESMIERVAKAQAEAAREWMARFVSEHPEQVGFVTRPPVPEIVRALAAVRALREPTEEMVDAGVNAKMRLYDKLEAEGKDVRTMVVADHPAGTIYQAMIDSILSDTEERG